MRSFIMGVARSCDWGYIGVDGDRIDGGCCDGEDDEKKSRWDKDIGLIIDIGDYKRYRDGKCIVFASYI